MSKRVRLMAEMGYAKVPVGWIEVTSSGRILEIYTVDPVVKVTTGGKHEDARCTSCAADSCVPDLVGVVKKDCLCCKSNHGAVDLEPIRRT